MSKFLPLALAATLAACGSTQQIPETSVELDRLNAMGLTSEPIKEQANNSPILSMCEMINMAFKTGNKEFFRSLASTYNGNMNPTDAEYQRAMEERMEMCYGTQPTVEQSCQELVDLVNQSIRVRLITQDTVNEQFPGYQDCVDKLSR